MLISINYETISVFRILSLVKYQIKRIATKLILKII